MADLLTDIPGVRLGHATDHRLRSGVTAVVFDSGAVAAVHTGGGAPGARDTALLDLGATVERVDALILSGGSTFGLDAGGGAQAALREAGIGAPFGGLRIPLAPQAILFDLANGGDKDWGCTPPYWEMGYRAVRDASSGSFALGSVGAGTGATTATVRGGLGSALETTAAGHRVAALVAVNAVGSPLIGDGPWFWAAPFERDGEFGGRGLPPAFTPELLRPRTKHGTTPATTIGLVVTDAVLTKPQAGRLARMADDGLARAIHPAHAPMDGDTIFAAATGAVPLDGARELTELGHAAGIAMARAIGRAVYWAEGVGSWREKFG